MLKLIIEDDEGRKTVVPFAREEITIGRQEGNTIRLSDRNVSRRHARLLRVNGHVVVEDLGSSNGTRINGERISGQSTVKDGDLIQIGDYDLALQSEAAAAAAASKRAAAAAAAADDEPSDPDGSASEPETELETPIQEEESSPGPAGGADPRRHSTAIIRMDQVEANRTRKVHELEAEEAPRLMVVSAELKGQEFACIRTEMKIGRTDDNDIVIDHRSLSRTHAKLVREDNGEWRIIDMQSANGLKVNNETYAQASLANGDVVELGHVKLRFVAAGENLGATESGGRSKLPIILALVVLLVGGGGAVAFVLKPELFGKGPGTPTTKPPETAQVDPPQQPQQPPQQPPPEQQAKAPDPAETKTPEPTNPNPPGMDPKEFQARVESAEKFLAEGKPEKAEDDLSPLKKADGTYPDEVQELASRIDTEKQVLEALRAGRKALDAKNLPEAERQLATADLTTVFAVDRDKLRTELEAVRKATTKVEPQTPRPPQQPPPPMAPSNKEQAKAAYEDAVRLHRAKQHHDAIIMGQKCLEIDPTFADCHILLGAAYASTEPKKLDMAATHYREFLKLAPNHRLAERIKKTLDDYEKQASPRAP